jgi:putative flippase GtrA
MSITEADVVQAALDLRAENLELLGRSAEAAAVRELMPNVRPRVRTVDTGLPIQGPGDIEPPVDAPRVFQTVPSGQVAWVQRADVSSGSRASVSDSPRGQNVASHGMRRLFKQFLRFGLIGCVGLVVDVGIFNLLRATVFNPDQIHEGPLFAKIVSTVLAISVNWVGNRYWTFRENRGPLLLREGVEFGVVSLVGMLIGLLSLFVSHYVLGYTSVLADNVSSNVIGLALGTAFRFTLYRFWVLPQRGEAEPGRSSKAQGRGGTAGSPDEESSSSRANHSR